jgi:MFS family permease
VATSVAPSSPPEPQHSATAALRLPGVLRLFVTSLVARFPMAALGVLFVLHARELGHSYAVGGAVAAASAIGTAIGSPVLGRLVDNRGQTPVLIAAALACSGALAGAAALGRQTPAVFLAALALLAGFMQPPVAAAARAVWGRKLDQANLHSVLALEASLQELAFMLGPIVLVSVVANGTPARGLAGAAVIFLLSTIAYALSPEPRAMTGRRATTQRRRSAMAVPGVRTLVLLAVTLGASFGAIEVGIAAFAEHSHHSGATGVLLGVWGLGSLLAGLAAARRGPRNDPVPELLRLHVVLTATNAILVVAPGTVALGVLLAIAGVAIAPLFAVLYRILSEVADDDSVTEAFSWELTGITSGVAIGSAVAGALAASTGPRAAFVAAAVATGLGALAGRARAGTLGTARPTP